MNYMAFSSLLVVITNSLIAIFSFLKAKGRSHLIIWGFLCVVSTTWGIGGVIFSTTKNLELAYLGWKIADVCAIFSPVLFFHFIHAYLNLKKKTILIAAYILGSFFILLSTFFPEHFIPDIKYVFNQYFTIDWIGQRNLIYLFFYLFCWWFLLPYSFYLAVKRYYLTHGILRNQLKYLILGSITGFVGGAWFFLPTFGLDVYPYLNILVALYPVVIGYAIIRYRLMDISVVITRTGIFVAVYSIVLGIPYWLAFSMRSQLTHLLGDMWWIIPLGTLTLLATAGPFIYLYFQRRAEDKLFQEQHRYQSTLRQASYGMGRIKDLKRLVGMIAHIVTRTVGLQHTMVYVNDKTNKQYILGAARSRQVRFETKEVVEYDSSIVQHLKKKKTPIVYEEIRQQTQDFGSRKLAQLEQELKDLDAAVVVPSFIDENLLAFCVLGDKVSEKPYSQDDLGVFIILANQAALAIENALFYDDIKKTHQQLVQAEKMATIGTMADGLSHQMNNRLHALGFIASDALDSIKMNKDKEVSGEIKELIVDMEHALGRIQSNVEQGGEIVRGLLRYTRKGEEGFAPVDLEELVNASFEMTQFKIKPGELAVVREYPNDLPKIKGNFTQLQEVVFNVIDNAYDAMMQKKGELKDPAYKPTLKVNASVKDAKLNIVFEDNGVGVKDEDKEKLFTPFFTTKASSKKGTGLGLYVMQKIVEENHGGTVRYESEFQKGTKTRIVLPTMV